MAFTTCIKLLTAVLFINLCNVRGQSDYDELRDDLIRTRNKLSDLEDRFESCREELIEYNDLHGKRDTDYERMWEHWTKCIKSLEMYKQRETEKDEEIEKLHEEAASAKAVFLEREGELAKKIQELESGGTICEVDDSVMEEKAAKEIENLKKALMKSEEFSAQRFIQLQELQQENNKLNELVQEHEENYAKIEKERDAYSDKFDRLEYKYRQMSTLETNVRDCTKELDKAQFDLKKKEEHMEKCGKSNNNCMKSRSNLQLEQKKWEYREEEYQQEIKKLKEQLEEVKNKQTDSEDASSEEKKLDTENNAKQVTKLHTELNACKKEVNSLQGTTKQAAAEKSSLNEQIINCKANVGKLEETKERLEMDKDGLYAQVKDCTEVKKKQENIEMAMLQLQRQAASSEVGLQKCEAEKKKKEEEDITVVKGLMEKKAKEMETTIKQVTDVNKETQMKLNSCEFSLQIKERELESARGMSESIKEKLEECEKKDTTTGDTPDTDDSDTDDRDQVPKKPKPAFYSSRDPVELCESKLSNVQEENDKLKVSNEAAEEDLLECKGVLVDCQSERDQLKMMNSGLRMVLDQTEPKYKEEIKQLKEEVRQNELVLAVVTNDAQKYMNLFGISVAILTGIVVIAAVKYGRSRYEQSMEEARLKRRKEKEDKKKRKR